jgi:hypothetical protein
LADDELGGEPEDLAQIRADDDLLNALAAQQNGAFSLGGHEADEHTVNGHGARLAGVDFDDEQLNALLLAWRQDVDSVPVPEMVDTKTAVATVTAARSARRRRPRLLVPVAAAAAILAIGFAGVGMAARDAEPGDPLWGLSKVLYADHARSVEAARSVRADLNDAQSALQQGKTDVAKDALAAAGSALSSVAREDGKDDLTAKHESLLEQLTSTPGPPPPTPGDRSESVKPVVPPATSSSSSTPLPTSVTPSSPPSQPPSSTPSTPSSTPPPPNSVSVNPPPPDNPPRSDSPGVGSGPNGVTPQISVGTGSSTPGTVSGN